MSSERTMEVQQQIRVNSENLQDFLTDLESWEKDMKRKDLENKSCESKVASKAISLDMKEAGNQAFKSGDYSKAIEYYTQGIEADHSKAALLLANRALAYMKIGKKALAEEDCTKCLSLDSRHVKALLRRGTIRAEEGRTGSAMNDFLDVLKIEPQNKEAKAALDKFNKRAESAALELAKLGPEFLPTFSDLEGDPINMNPGPSSDTCSKKPMISTIKTDPVKSGNITKAAATNSKKQDIKKAPVPEQTVRLEPPKVVPEVAQRSYQFFADWSRLDGQHELQFQYLKNFPPQKFPTMFAQSMDAMVFSGVLRILSEEFVPRGVEVYEYIRGLSGVGRFKTLLSMLSESEMKYVSGLMQQVDKSDASDKDDIVKRYQR